ncbi:hypothetical protein E2C01_087613 [Portunus trituberculatus]|uniref:Uncharacterized protein n=1 Tax=Portunus trituberculatus TaxID=210409 RepID=A0A5B7J719_PORTR|nr:hypothetical protein [Portunus trituberculatus]
MEVVTFVFHTGSDCPHNLSLQVFFPDRRPGEETRYGFHCSASSQETEDHRSPPASSPVEKPIAQKETKALFSVILFIRLLPGSALTPVYVNKTTYFSHINEQDLEKQYLKYNPAILKPSMYYAPNESFAADTAVYLADRLGWPANGWFRN